MSHAFETTLQEATEMLRTTRKLLAAEISAYPTPISGCDAQFNHLLSVRAGVTSALRAIENPPFVPTSRQLEPNASSA